MDFYGLRWILWYAAFSTHRYIDLHRYIVLHWLYFVSQYHHIAK
jgi:hypothetical protein